MEELSSRHFCRHHHAFSPKPALAQAWRPARPEPDITNVAHRLRADVASTNLVPIFGAICVQRVHKPRGAPSPIHAARGRKPAGVFSKTPATAAGEVCLCTLRAGKSGWRRRRAGGHPHFMRPVLCAEINAASAPAARTAARG